MSAFNVKQIGYNLKIRIMKKNVKLILVAIFVVILLVPIFLNPRLKAHKQAVSSEWTSMGLELGGIMATNKVQAVCEKSIFTKNYIFFSQTVYFYSGQLSKKSVIGYGFLGKVHINKDAARDALGWALENDYSDGNSLYNLQKMFKK